MNTFKRMAGTAGVFIRTEHNHASPVERDGLIWTDEELKLKTAFFSGSKTKEAMASVLALEGLEEYEPPENGDIRFVDTINSNFIYVREAKAWVQLNSTK